MELYDTYQAKILACVEAMEQQLKRFEALGDPKQLPMSKKNSVLPMPPPLMYGVSSTGCAAWI